MLSIEIYAGCMTQKKHFAYLLHHLVFVMGRQSDQVLQERLGIGFSQFKIMSVLARRPHIQQKEIANILGQTEASISRQIKLLTEQGFLQAVPRPENRRERITTLTAKGERYTDEAVEILDNFHQPLYDVLSEKQLAALTENLTAMHERACRDSKSGSCYALLNTTT